MKGYRKIVVDGVSYLYKPGYRTNIRDGEGEKTLLNARMRMSSEDDYFSVTPRDVEKIIRTEILMQTIKPPTPFSFLSGVVNNIYSVFFEEIFIGKG